MKLVARIRKVRGLGDEGGYVAFKLSKVQLAEKAKLVESLQNAKSALDTAVEEANKAIQVAKDNVNHVIDTYNTALAEIRDFIEERKSSWQDEFDEKSETWQHGEKGEMVAEMLGEWDNIDLEDLDHVEIDGVELEAEHVNEFDELPVEVEG
jgi:chemotaxis regulatin CheY-phosphate phosphatase CheZ